MCLASSIWKLHFQADPLSRTAGETDGGLTHLVIAHALVCSWPGSSAMRALPVRSSQNKNSANQKQSGCLYRSCRPKSSLRLLRPNSGADDHCMRLHPLPGITASSLACMLQVMCCDLTCCNMGEQRNLLSWCNGSLGMTCFRRLAEALHLILTDFSITMAFLQQLDNLCRANQLTAAAAGHQQQRQRAAWKWSVAGLWCVRLRLCSSY